MSSIRKYYTQKAGFPVIWGLVFFIWFLGCRDEKNEGSIRIDWVQGKAARLIIDRGLIGNASPNDIHIRLSGSGTDVLGEYSYNSETIFFKPVLPFTNGLSYELFLGNKQISKIKIENPEKTGPAIQSVFPITDTVPVNLLKIYLAFSKPMQEGVAMKNIKVIKNGRDTVPVFLELEQELWNKENTLLTFWLDPGRIKRDLQPNIKEGPPLEENNHYQLVLVEPWSDQQGLTLPKQILKQFFTAGRDTISPVFENWKLAAPPAGTRKPLTVYTNEILDQVMLENTILVWDKNKNRMEGSIKPTKDNLGFQFTPGSTWEKGNYIMEAEKRLEDLAGNNLERLFDQNIQDRKENPNKKFLKHFQIQ